MLSAPDISIVVAAYNAESTIRGCLESVLRLTDDSWELIVVDDGSADKTGSVLDDMLDADPRCKVIHQTNKGRSAARNVGIKASSGKWITFLDADDRMLALPDSKYLSDNSSYQSVWCGYCTGQAGLALPIIAGESLPSVGQTKALVDLSIDVNHVTRPIGGFDGSLERTVWATYYNRETLSNGNIYFNTSLSYGEDFEFNIRFLLYSKEFLALPLVSYEYSEDSPGTMRSFSKDSIPELDLFCKSLINDFSTYIYSIDLNPIIGNEVSMYIRRAGRFGTIGDIESLIGYYLDNSYLLDGLKSFRPPSRKQRTTLLVRKFLIGLKCPSLLFRFEQLLLRLSKS